MADSNNPQVLTRNRRFWRTAGHALHIGVALLLTLTFLLQSHVVIELLSRGYVQAPSLLLDRINDRVHFRGASLAAESLIYHQGGRITANGLRLGDYASGARLAAVEQLTLLTRSAPREGVTGGMRLDIEGGRLFKGDIDEETLFEGVEGRLSFLGNGWVLENLQARHRIMTLSTSGSLPHAPKVNAFKRLQKRLWGERKPEPERIPDIASSLQAIVAGLDAVLQHLPEAEQTHLHLALTTVPDAPSCLVAEANFHSGRLVTHFGAMGPVVADGQLLYDLNTRDYTLQASGRFDSLRSPQFGIRAEDLQFAWESESNRQPHSRLNIATGQLNYRLQSIDRTVLWATVDSLQAINCELVVTLDRTTQLAANARVNLLKTEADLEFSGTVDPILLVEHPLLKPLTPRLPVIEIMERPYLNAKVRLANGFRFKSGTLRARIEPLRLDNITIDYADALLKTDGVAFAVQRALLETGPHHGYVSADYHSENGDYAVKLEGIFDPNSISSMVGSWWDSIFSPFDFSEIGASWADFVIRGNHSQRRPSYFNGSVHAESVGFEGLHIDSGHLKVRGTPTFVELFDLYALHESGGTISGSIFWKIVPYSDTGPKIYHLLLDAEIDPAVIVPALPTEAARWAAAFKVEQSPTVHLEVRQHNPDFDPPADANHIFMRAASSGPVAFEGIPLDALAFTFYSKGERISLRQTRFGLADGKGSLDLDRWFDAENTSQLRFQFELEDALRSEALAVVQDYLERNADDVAGLPTPLPTTTAKRTEEDRHENEAADSARISVRLDAEGPELDPMAFVGSGQFNLKDPNLASIPLLGPISRLFEGTPLGFTSMRLNTMHGDFHLQREQVFFPQLMIVGSVGEVEAIGTYRVPDKALDFRLHIRLFGQLIETPGFIRRITRNINPFPGILEGNLGGTLDEPRWRSAYDPRSWLPFIPSGDH